jgi:hypothetical protein
VHLPLHLLRTTQKGYQSKLYRSAVSDCANCPLRTECLGQGSSKQIEDSVDKPYYDRMHQRLQTAKAKRMKKLRSATVEPVIGTLVNYLGMKRVNTHGLELANKCMVMAAVAYNLKKLLKYQSNSRATAVNVLKAAVKNCLSALFCCLVQPLIPKVTAQATNPPVSRVCCYRGLTRENDLKYALNLSCATATMDDSWEAILKSCFPS